MNQLPLQTLAGVVLPLTVLLATPSATALDRLDAQICSGVSLASEETAPFEPVLFNMDDPGGSDWLVRVEEDGHELMVLPLRIEGNTATAIIPMAPSGRPEADASLNITAGQLVDGEPVWCEISHPMAMAAMAWSTTVGGLEAELVLLREMLEGALEELGWTGATLAAADPAELEDDALLLWGPARLAFGPNGIEPMWGALEPAIQEIADALVEGTQRHREPRPETLGDWPDAPPVTPEPPAPPAPPGGQPPAPLGMPDMPGIPGLPDGTPGEPPPGGTLGLPPADAGQCQAVNMNQLGHGMGRQVSGAAMQSGGAGLALKAGQEIGGLPIISRVGLPTVLLAWAVDFVSSYQEGTQPSQFETMWLEYIPGELTEDDTGGGEVTNVGLRFSSTGFDMGPALADLALIAAGELAGRGLSSTLKRGGERAAAEQLARGLEQAVNLPASAVHADVISEIFVWYGALVADGAIDRTGVARGALTIEPDCWDASEPVDANGGGDSNQRFHFTRAIEQGGAENEYLAASTGAGRIDVRWDVPVGQGIVGIGLSDATRNASHTFGASGTVLVPPLIVALSPQRADVQAGETITFDLRVGPAADRSVELSDSLGLLDERLDDGDGHRFTYTVPSDQPAGTSIRITAESLADEGLRAPSHPQYRGPLEGVATLRIEQPRLYLSPTQTCVQPGQSVTYEALDDPLTGDPVPVRWEASNGRIDNRGRFTAPDSDGSTVTLTATALADPELSASWTLNIGDCRISWHVTLSGAEAPVPFASGDRGGVQIERRFGPGYQGALARPGNENPQPPYLIISLAPSRGANPEPPRDMTVDEMRAWLMAAHARGNRGIVPDFVLTLPGATPGRTGRLEESFVQMGSFDSRADHSSDALIDGALVRGPLRTAEITLVENSPQRLRGHFHARLIDSEVARPDRGQPVIQGPGFWDRWMPGSGIHSWPDREITVTGSFDFHFDD